MTTHFRCDDPFRPDHPVLCVSSLPSIQQSGIHQAIVVASLPHLEPTSMTSVVFGYLKKQRQPRDTVAQVLLTAAPSPLSFLAFVCRNDIYNTYNTSIMTTANSAMNKAREVAQEDLLKARVLAEQAAKSGSYLYPIKVRDLLLFDAAVTCIILEARQMGFWKWFCACAREVPQAISAKRDSGAPGLLSC